jgi:hypothetical protein
VCVCVCVCVYVCVCVCVCVFVFVFISLINFYSFSSQKNREQKTTAASNFNVYIPSLENDVGRKQIEDVLVSTRGVLSFVLDTKQRK